MSDIDNIDKDISTYFNNMNLDDELQSFYKLINKKDTVNELENKTNFNNLRNSNYNRYINIPISKYYDLPKELSNVTNDIIILYNFLNIEDLLTEDYFHAEVSEQILNQIDLKIKLLNEKIKHTLKLYENQNNENQKKISIEYIKNLNVKEEIKTLLIDKYSALILYNSYYSDDIYYDLKKQYNRKKYLDEIFKIISISENKYISDSMSDRILELNIKINDKINEYNCLIQYLNDIIIPDSKYIKEYNTFIDMYNKIIAYDDLNYDNVKQTYDILYNDKMFKDKFKMYETLFIEESGYLNKELDFIYNKIGKKNINTSLNYISSNYIDILSLKEKETLESLYDQLKLDDVNLEELENKMKLLITSIWNKKITKLDKYNILDDYCFICSNNQFIDEKYETILLTKNIISHTDDLKDYQIGFICEYNDNIMYITENDDIMSVKNMNDMSYLKTPIQIEKEYINFNITNKIALNGFKTKIIAVYLINDGNINNYNKALELSNIYNIPLVILKR